MKCELCPYEGVKVAMCEICELYHCIHCDDRLHPESHGTLARTPIMWKKGL